MSVNEELRDRYPGGHPNFIPMTVDEIELHSKKNQDYAKGGDPLGNFKRVAQWLSAYPNLDLSRPSTVALVYAAKQIDAALWMLSQKYEGQVEGIQDRLRDVHVYMKLARILLMEEAGNTNQYEPNLKAPVVGASLESAFFAPFLKIPLKEKAEEEMKEALKELNERRRAELLKEQTCKLTPKCS